MHVSGGAAGGVAGDVRYRVAGFWRRAAATWVDAILVLPLAVLAAGVATAAAGGSLPRAGELGFGYVVHLAVDGGMAGVAALIAAGLVLFLFQLVFSATTGQ